MSDASSPSGVHGNDGSLGPDVADSERFEFRVLAVVLFDEEGPELVRKLNREQFTGARARALFAVSHEWHRSNPVPIEPAVLESRLVDTGRSAVEAAALVGMLQTAWVSVAGQDRAQLVLELERRAVRRKRAELVLAARLALIPPNVDPIKAFELLELALKPSNDNADTGDWRPSVVDPISGLVNLAPIALLSRARYLELAAQPVAYTWRDILVAGTIGVLAGAPGSGKTTLAYLYAAARAASSGSILLLGRQVYAAHPAQRLVVIEAEHSEPSAARKLLASLRLLGLSDAVLEHGRVITIARKAVTLGSPAWREVVQLMQLGLVSDVIVDTVARFAPGDANAEAEQVAIYDRIAQALEQAPGSLSDVPPPTCLLVAHTRKGAATDDLEGVSGSAQRVGQADTVLLAEATRDGGRVLSTRVTFSKLREDPGDRWPAAQSFSIVEGALIQEVAPGRVSAPTPAETQAIKLDADAYELAELVQAIPGLGTRELQRVAQEKLGWGKGRCERVESRLRDGVHGVRLVDRSTNPKKREWVIERDEPSTPYSEVDR
jgi:energy-coupling factor transporter ATP-binding protein EcfA2